MKLRERRLGVTPPFNDSEVGMLCVSVASRTVMPAAYTRMVMTIREKFADLRFLVSKYKDTSMVLFLSEGR